MSNEYKIPKKIRKAFRFSYNKRYYIFHPLFFLKELYTEIKGFIHRGLYGYAVYNCWDVNSYVADLLVGMLQHMRDHGSSSPMLDNYDVTDEHVFPEMHEEWKKILTKMIIGFDAESERRIYNHPNFNEKYGYDPTVGIFEKKEPWTKEGWNQIQEDEESCRNDLEEALELFKKYFLNLWD